MPIFMVHTLYGECEVCMTPYVKNLFKPFSIFLLFAFALTSLQSPSLAQVDNAQLAPWANTSP